MYPIGTFKTTFFVLSLKGIFCNIDPMDNKAVRYKNARSLIDEVGSLEAFAEKIERAPTQCSAFAGANPRKGIGDRMARHIEDKFGKLHGWMDREHSNEDEPPRAGEIGKPKSAGDGGRFQALLTLGKLIEDFTPSELAELEAQVELIRRRKGGGF